MGTWHGWGITLNSGSLTRSPAGSARQAPSAARRQGLFGAFLDLEHPLTQALGGCFHQLAWSRGDNGVDLYEDKAMRLLAVLASVGAAIGLAAPAQADPNADFLAGLNNAGITYQGGSDAIGIGQRACQLLDQGHSEADVIKGMTEQNSGFTTDGATKFVQIAENTLCPQHIGGAAQAPPPPKPAPDLSAGTYDWWGDPHWNTAGNW
jgi:hypothetical protein